MTGVECARTDLALLAHLRGHGGRRSCAAAVRSSVEMRATKREQKGKMLGSSPGFGVQQNPNIRLIPGSTPGFLLVLSQ